jgi:hypothetical protein
MSHVVLLWAGYFHLRQYHDEWLDALARVRVTSHEFSIQIKQLACDTLGRDDRNYFG